MALQPLPLDPIVNIAVNLAMRSAVRKSFDLALLIGQTSVFTQGERIKIYSSTDEMLEDGFNSSDRLYKAAQLIFSQELAPQRVAIGCIGTVAEDDGEGGTTTRTESPLETFTACRRANDEWYIGIYCNDITNEGHLAIAAYVQTVKPATIYAYTTSDSNAIIADGDGIFERMRGLGYGRTIGQYSTKHPDAIAAITGWAMGAMNQNIAYTLAYKREIGVDTENSNGIFSDTAVSVIKANYGNVYINRGTYYNIFEEGCMSDGAWFDERIFLDKYTNDIQLSVMDLLYSTKKVPHTEPGVNSIINKIASVCDKMNKEGFIESGVWLAGDVKNLKTGDALPRGYVIQSDSVSEQSQADRDARKAPPIYVCLKLAGAIHYVTIEIDVNR